MTTYDEGHAGPVRVTRPGSAVDVQPAYTKRERDAIIRQGKDRPRALTHDETTLATANRRRAREDSLAMEVWYRYNCRGPYDFKARHPGSVEVWARTVSNVPSDRWR
jgi:hypothetical protein